MMLSAQRETIEFPQASTGTRALSPPARKPHALRMGSRSFAVSIDKRARGPWTFEDAGEQFVKLMQDAVERGFIPPSIRFSGLAEYYATFVREFGWPEMSGKRLALQLLECGCVKTIRRDRKGGADKREIAYLIPAKSFS